MTCYDPNPASWAGSSSLLDGSSSPDGETAPGVGVGDSPNGPPAISLSSLSVSQQGCLNLLHQHKELELALMLA